MYIQQGDQYAIPIKIFVEGVMITPENCTDVRVKIGDKMVSYDEGLGDLVYNPVDENWCFPLTEDISFGYEYTVKVQSAVKFDSDYIYSPVQTIDIGSSIIKDFWSGEIG